MRKYSLTVSYRLRFSTVNPRGHRGRQAPEVADRDGAEREHQQPHVTFAATGDSLILGQTNKANARTVIERTTDGAVPKLTTNSNGDAPFVTNGTGKVDNLNADKLDGHSSGYFATADLAPVAAAVVQANGTISGSHGVDSVTWDGSFHRYAITLTGISFLYTNYAVNVSTIGSPIAVGWGSASGDLLVYFDGDVQSQFSCTVFQLP
jgi:hypothetical protein